MSPLFAREVVDCVSQGREPTVPELFHVAERMWAEGAGGRSALAWGNLPPEGVERVSYLRAAQVALCGTTHQR